LETLILSDFDPKYEAQLANQRKRSLQTACIVARLSEEFRGKDTVVLDLTEVTPIVDFFVITTGTNPRQMVALTEEVRKVLKSQGSLSRSLEGEAGNTWILQDYGDVVLHVFHPDARLLYDLESLWADAPRVDWKALAKSLPAAALSAAAKATVS
jgi:ribosome-associated protein